MSDLCLLPIRIKLARNVPAHSVGWILVRCTQGEIFLKGVLLATSKAAWPFPGLISSKRWLLRDWASSNLGACRRTHLQEEIPSVKYPRKHFSVRLRSHPSFRKQTWRYLQTVVLDQRSEPWAVTDLAGLYQLVCR